MGIVIRSSVKGRERRDNEQLNEDTRRDRDGSPREIGALSN